MITDTLSNPFHQDLVLIKERVYDPCGFEMTQWKWQTQSSEYGACSFYLNGKAVQYRAAKITPTKAGLFVTIWKRNQEGITRPFEMTDELDLIIVSTRSGDKLGQFIFPKSVLIDKGIVSSHQKEGKRGIRVYPPWEEAGNKQAEKTQAWQTRYFFRIEEKSLLDLNQVKTLLSLL